MIKEAPECDPLVPVAQGTAALGCLLASTGVVTAECPQPVRRNSGKQPQGRSAGWVLSHSSGDPSSHLTIHRLMIRSSAPRAVCRSDLSHGTQKRRTSEKFVALAIVQDHRRGAHIVTSPDRIH
jgi:hypothetical protein